MPHYPRSQQMLTTLIPPTHQWKASVNLELKSTYQTKYNLMWLVKDTQAIPAPTLNLPYEGTKAMLRIGDVWIASIYADHIQFASTAPKLKDYCMRRHKWDTSTMELVHWDAIESNGKKMGWADKFRTTKVVHGWLSVMHNLGKYKKLTQCPGCPCHDETFEHMYSCTHPLMKKQYLRVNSSFWTEQKIVGYIRE